ncbi:MAG: hypothetical protein VBE63_01555 [Lamprobacter sp.]|uniref:hypothetical protein n=1 Tax=Lamprobacter sp. TaxID=3100796 RepID=UPI002B256DBD|nr:hypothetical protein [Lamprobacter sp.]MEA3638612.1 hypothetical protein [Lamprobacter sp.]
MSEARMNNDQQTAKSGWNKVLFVSLPYLALYVASIVLTAMTDSAPERATELWKMFMPFVALVSLIGGWRLSGEETKDKAIYIGKQVLYWGAVLLVINLLFMGDTAHFLNAESQGFIVAYVLGLSALLSGIYIDWKMSLFGAFLIASTIGIAFLEDNALLISTVMAALAGIAITVVLRRSGKAS